MALKDFNKKLFSQISASAADPTDTNTTFRKKQRIPKALKEADFFNQNLVDSTRIVRQGNKFYVPISKVNFRSMTTDFIENNFNANVAAQLSSSFNEKFTLASLPDDVVILGEEGASITASYTTNAVGGIGTSVLLFTNTSQNAGGASWSFSPGGLDHAIHQNEFTASWSHLFNPTTLSGSSLANNANPATLSGSSPVAVGTSVFINGADDNDGKYTRFVVKARLFGDGDETTFDFDTPGSSEYIPPREFLFYEDNIKVASGGFLHHPTRPDNVVSLGTEEIVYWPVSSSTAVQLPYSGTLAQNGTLLYSNATLTEAAANGFYYPTGRQTMVGTYNNTTNLVFGAQSGSYLGNTDQLVPRIYTSSFTPQS